MQQMQMQEQLGGAAGQSMPKAEKDKKMKEFETKMEGIQKQIDEAWEQVCHCVRAAPLRPISHPALQGSRDPYPAVHTPPTEARGRLTHCVRPHPTSSVGRAASDAGGAAGEGRRTQGAR